MLGGLLPLRSVRLAADVTSTSLTNGEVGGSLGVADFAIAVAVLGLAIDEVTVRAVAHPDLEQDSFTRDCAGISTALRFEAVSATAVP